MNLGQHLLIYAFKPLTHFYKEFENADLVCGFSVTRASVVIIIKKKRNKITLLSHQQNLQDPEVYLGFPIETSSSK